MTITRKVKDLTNAGNIQDGDVIVGERTTGTTVLVTVTGVTKLAGIETGADVTDEANVVAALDGASLSTTTVATDDKVLIQDTSDADNLKYVTAQAIADLAAGGVSSVNGETGNVTLTTDDISDTAQTHKFTTATDITRLADTSGTNTGDQTSIVGITGTKAEFDTAVTDGNILYVGDVTQYTDEMAQDAIGAMVDTTLEYVDATPLLKRAALTGDVTASSGSNTTTIVTPSSVTIATDDKVLIKDTSASDVMAYVTTQNIRDLAPGSGTLTSAQLAAALTDETGTGAAVFANTPTLTTPVLGAATATSINFGQSTLNYYETGTFTPVLTFVTPGDLSVSYSVQSGVYRRVGGILYVRFSITATPTFTTASGIMQVTGSPFSASASSFGVCYTSSTGLTLPAGRTWAVTTISSSSAVISFIAAGSAVAASSILASNVTSGTAVTIASGFVYSV